MSTIGGAGGPGGIGGPKRPGGPDELAPADDVGGVDSVVGDGQVEGAQRTLGTTGIGDIDALAAELAAGRLTPREAIDRLVDAAAGPGLDATERAELRELLTDLVANDPHLGSLVGNLIGRS
jgi:hypothetical protein